MNPDQEQPKETPDTTSAEPTMSSSDQASVTDAINELAMAAAGGDTNTTSTPVAGGDTNNVTPTPATESAVTSIQITDVPNTPSPDIAAAAIELDADAAITTIDAPETTPENVMPKKIGIQDDNSAIVVNSIDSTPSSINIETPDEADSVINRPDGPEVNIVSTINGNDAGGSKEIEVEEIVEEEDKIDNEPLKPADPVPGSIGSALSYSEVIKDATDKNAPAPAATPNNVVKKKSNTSVVIILAIILVLGIIGAIIFFIVSSSSNQPTTTPSTSNNNVAYIKPKTDSSASLICSHTSTSKELDDIDDSTVASYSLKMIANYSDGELIDLSLTDTYNYISSEAAAEAAKKAKFAYQESYIKLGLKDDPFSSNYPVSGDSFSIMHVAEAKDINTTNAALLRLPVGVNEKVLTDIDSVRENYISFGYSCSGDTSNKNSSATRYYTEESIKDSTTSDDGELENTEEDATGLEE